MEEFLARIKNWKVTTLRDEIYGQIKEAILDGGLKPGEKLNIDALSEKVGRSRTPVREAILKLEQEDLVERLPQGGFMVSCFSARDIEEIFGIRVVLEGYAVSLSSEHITVQGVDDLKRIVEESVFALKQHDLRRIGKLNIQFHQRVAQFSQSTRLCRMIDDLMEVVYRYGVAILSLKGMPQISFGHHRDIIDALNRRSIEEAKTLLCDHINKGKERILQEIQKGNIALS